MKTLLQPGRLVLIPETTEEANGLEIWKAAATGSVFLEELNSGIGLSLRDLGPPAVDCREPLNIAHSSPDPALRLISNLAATPFVLDGGYYASVEGFWQGLKFADEAERRRVAQLTGHEAKHAGDAAGYGDKVEYRGAQIAVGTWSHWQLMRRACEAKFTQHDAAREALIATAPRPLMHQLRRDSRAIPGVIMADIWMQVRKKLCGH